MADTPNPLEAATKPKKEFSSSHRAVRRGLALIAPPLLTLVLFLWVWSIVENNILVPLENVAKYLIVSSTSKDVYFDRIPAGVDPDDLLVKKAGELVPLSGEINDNVEPTEARQLADRYGLGPVYFRYKNEAYVPLGHSQWITRTIYDTVNLDPGDSQLRTGRNYYERFVELKYLKRWLVIPIFLSLFVCFLYFLGIFLAAGVGRFIWNAAESLVHRFPLIRNVYGSVKQISDFLLTEQEVTFMKVVAIEYPRKGIWSLGFVTGESMLDIRSAANEPVLTLLIPTSPMPATGFTITVLKSETVDMNLTVDQALQFIVSCGVVVPAPQQYSNDSPRFSSPRSGIASENGDGSTDPGRSAPSPAAPNNGNPTPPPTPS